MDDNTRAIWGLRANTDGAFATALAILHLTESVDRLREDLCFGTEFANGNRAQGCLEKIAIEMQTLARNS